MRNVVFVAPFFLPTTVSFIDAVAGVDGARTALVSQEGQEKLPPSVRGKLAAHYRVEDALDPIQIIHATRALGERMGPIQTLVGALEELQVPLAVAREGLRIPGMDVDTAQNFRDKARMKTVLRAAGVPCARHRLVTTEAEARDFVNEVGLPVVAKPPAGSGARNTFRIDNEDALRGLLATLPPRPGNPTLFEEFITGEEHSFDSFFVRGELVWWSVSRYFPTPLEVMQNPWIQWVVHLPREIDVPAYQEIRQVAERALAALGLVTGLTHMEWFRRTGGSVAVSEVAARPPGAHFTNLISHAHDIDFQRAWARLMVLGEVPSANRPYSSGAAYLRGQGHGRVKAIHGIEAIEDEIGPLVVESNLPWAGQSPSGTYEGEGYVILRHPETAVVEQALKKLVSSIRVELG